LTCSFVAPGYTANATSESPDPLPMMPYNVDYYNTGLAIDKLRALAPRSQPFFLALGLTSARLPWSYPQHIADQLYPLSAMTPPKNPQSHPNDFEWIRQVSLSFFQKISNTRNLTQVEACCCCCWHCFAFLNHFLLDSRSRTSHDTTRCSGGAKSVLFCCHVDRHTSWTCDGRAA
jgi:hypothetical protein